MDPVGEYETIRAVFLSSATGAVTENKNLRQFIDRGLYSWATTHDQFYNVGKNNIPEGPSQAGSTDFRGDNNIIQLIATMTLQSLTVKDVAV